MLTCPKCGSPCYRDIVTCERYDDNQIKFTFEKVPAKICTNCGEEWIATYSEAKMELFILEGNQLPDGYVDFGSL